MNIVIQNASCAPGFVRNSWAKVFRSIGNNVFLWQKENCPTFDLFHKIKPIDILIMNTYDCDEGSYRCLKQYPETKVAMFASSWGPLVDKLDRKEFPIVYVTDSEKRILEKLKKEHENFKFVFIHVTDKYLDATMGGWNSIGIKPVGILNGADVFSYLNGVEKREYISEISYIGGKWPYKSRNIDKTLLPLCEFPSKYKIKIWGNTPWPVPQYLGQIEEEEVKHVFASAKVCPNISESHSTSLGFDLVERIYKIPLSGMLVSDAVDELGQVFTENEVPVYKNKDELIGIVDWLIKSENDRKLYKERQKRRVLASETYFHRCFKMLSHFGLQREADKCLRVYKEKYGNCFNS